MIEIRIHGRGGQGNVVAAYLLATAAFEVGRHCQAFPAFGAERRGAPVTAFVRIDDRPIRRRSQVHAPRFLIVQDPGLLHLPGTTAGLAAGGGILANAGESSEAVGAVTGHPTVAINATAMAMEVLGRPMPNVPLLAAFLAVTGLLPVEALSKALAERFSGEVLEKNRELVRAAAAAAPAGLWQEAADA